MNGLTNLVHNAPIIKEDLTLGILSCTINVEGVIKTYYFQHVEGGVILNRELQDLLMRSFEKANIQDGDNGISTHLDSFIPTEIMDSSLVGLRQIGVEYYDRDRTSLTVEHVGLKTKMPQALLYHMLDEGLEEYKKDSKVLGFDISSQVINQSKLEGYYSFLDKFVQSRGLQQVIFDGVELGYKIEDKIGMKLARLRREARIIDTRAKEIAQELKLTSSFSNLDRKTVEMKKVPRFGFLPKFR
jgi:hypothetical protein